MDNQEQQGWFQDIETIVSEPLNFKSKLAIGEDAYTSLKLKNAVFETWEVAGVATTAVVVAKSSAIATTFFCADRVAGGDWDWYSGNTCRWGNCRWGGDRGRLGWHYALFEKSLGEPIDRDSEVH